MAMGEEGLPVPTEAHCGSDRVDTRVDFILAAVGDVLEARADRGGEVGGDLPSEAGMNEPGQVEVLTLGAGNGLALGVHPTDAAASTEECG